MGKTTKYNLILILVIAIPKPTQSRSKAVVKAHNKRKKVFGGQTRANWGLFNHRFGNSKKPTGKKITIKQSWAASKFLYANLYDPPKPAALLISSIL